MTREEIEKIASDYLNNRESELDMFEVFVVAKEALEQKPKTGHWVKHNTPNNTHYYDCSLCGCVAPCTETAYSYLWKLSNFCPIVEQR